MPSLVSLQPSTSRPACTSIREGSRQHLPWEPESSTCHIGWSHSPASFPPGTQTAWRQEQITWHVTWPCHVTTDLLKVSCTMRNLNPERLRDWKLLVILVASIFGSDSEVASSGCLCMILFTWRSNPSARYEEESSAHNTPVKVARMTMWPMAGVCWGRRNQTLDYCGGDHTKCSWRTKNTCLLATPPSNSNHLLFRGRFFPTYRAADHPIASTYTHFTAWANYFSILISPGTHAPI